MTLPDFILLSVAEQHEVVGAKGAYRTLREEVNLHGVEVACLSASCGACDPCFVATIFRLAGAIANVQEWTFRVFAHDLVIHRG